MNECLKVVRYEPKDHFCEHRDGPWIPREDEASIFTVLVYLTVPLLGGETGLLNVTMDGRMGQRAIEAAAVPPVEGMAIVFNHDCWHYGSPVKDGTKTILRTEMVFRRTHSIYLDRYLYKSDPAYDAMKRMYAESQLCLDKGDREGFFTRYQDVIGMQRAAMVATLETQCAVGSLARFVADALAHVLHFLPLVDVLSLMLTSRGHYYLVLQSPMWMARCLEEYPEVVQRVSTRVFRDTVFPVPRTVSPGQPLPFAPIDWITAYAQVRTMRRWFTPAASPATAAGWSSQSRHNERAFPGTATVTSSLGAIADAR